MMKKSRSYEFIPLSNRNTPSEDDDSTDQEEANRFDILYRKATEQRRRKLAGMDQSRLLGCKFLLALMLGIVVIVSIVAIAFSMYFLIFISIDQQPRHPNVTGISSSTADTSAKSAPPASSRIHQEFHQSRTELSMIAHDVNRDGILDIIMATVAVEVIDKVKYFICPDKESSCMQDYGVEPCQVRLFALSGQNGEVVWEKWLPFSPFAINCNHDLNGDTIPDCTISGRNGAFAAITPGQQTILWYVDPSITVPSYNYYYPLLVRDFDHDGTIDIIITHGGDPVYSDNVRNRSPGYVVVVSGRTGQQLSDRILMPDGHETYNSPIAYNITDNTEVVVFGSGGETIGGSLWAITLNSLQDHVNSWLVGNKSTTQYQVNMEYFDTRCLSDNDVKHMRPKFQKDTYKYIEEKKDWLANCPVWKSDIQPLWNIYKLCVYEVMSTEGGNGYIVPPVIIDNNRDGVKDILISPLNDHVIMVDGATNTKVWDHHERNTQSYSIPSPLHFNDDDIPDYLLRLNKGKWLNYDYSYLAVIDGSNGQLLWSLNCSMGAMGSAITVKSREKGQDGVIFMASGCDEETAASGKSKRGILKKNKSNNFLNDQDTCPMTHSGTEQSVTCANTKRHKRLSVEDEAAAIQELEEYLNEYDGPQVLRPLDIDFSDIIDDGKVAMDDIWEGKAVEYPDPWNNSRAFIQDYCGIPYDRFVSKMYFLTPKMMKSGNVKPILVYSPYVQKFSTSYQTTRSKRHGGVDIDGDGVQMAMELLQDKRNTRCAHVMVPMMQETSPTLGDFDKDGNLEVAASLVMDGFPGAEYYALSIFHPAKVVMDVFTIKDKVVSSYGVEIRDIVDFSAYYSMEEQPWGQYMGSKGNGVYDA